MTFRAKVVVNASGPWVDDVRKAGGIDRKKIIYPTKGIHLIMPKLSEQSLFVASRDGRMFFIIPLDKWSLIGTTDTKYDGDLDEVHADAADVDYLLKESRRILPGLNLTKDKILYTYAGVRPLAFAGERESRISRKHRVVIEGRTGRIITIAGGKYTTYRNMAEDVVDAACRKLGKRVSCETDRKPLAGSLPAEFYYGVNHYHHFYVRQSLGSVVGVVISYRASDACYRRALKSARNRRFRCMWWATCIRSTLQLGGR